MPAEPIKTITPAAPAAIVARVVRPSQAAPDDDVASDTDDQARASDDSLSQKKSTMSYD
jgi:hypothetical protein